MFLLTTVVLCAALGPLQDSEPMITISEHLDAQKALLASCEQTALGRVEFYDREWTKLARANLRAARIDEAADCLRRTNLSDTAMLELARDPEFAVVLGTPWADVFGEEALLRREKLHARRAGRNRLLVIDRDVLREAEYPGSFAEHQEITQEEVWLKPRWMREGSYRGVTFNPHRRELIVSEFGGLVSVLDPEGEELGYFLASKDAERFELSLGLGDDQDVLVGHSTWARALQAWRRDETGDWRPYWYRRFELPAAVDDSAIGDVDGDGAWEVLVNYNGSSGTDVLSSSGTWLGNYPSQSGKFICTQRSSDRDQDRAFSIRPLGQGEYILDMLAEGGEWSELCRLPFYPCEMAAAADDLLLAGYTEDLGGVLAGLSLDGETRWTLEVGDFKFAKDIECGPQGLVAVTGHDELHLLRAQDGQRLALAWFREPSKVATVHDSAWIDGADGVRLVVATNAGLFAYDLRNR